MAVGFMIGIVIAIVVVVVSLVPIIVGASTSLAETADEEGLEAVSSIADLLPVIFIAVVIIGAVGFLSSSGIFGEAGEGLRKKSSSDSVMSSKTPKGPSWLRLWWDRHEIKRW